MNLGDIAAKINECRKKSGYGHCPFGEQGVGKATHQVGTNNVILIVGEAPATKGWWVTGRAFYGEKDNGCLKLLRSGKYLNDCLRLLHTKLEESYYLDAVKCRPDKSAWHPSWFVRQNCRRFLEEQIVSIRPLLVIPLGRVATASCLEIRGEKIASSFKLEDVVGWPKEWEAPWGKCWIIPLYFPSDQNNALWPRNKDYLKRFMAEQVI